MKEATLQVKLLTYTPDPEAVVTAAAKLCYSPCKIDVLMDNLTPKSVESFINKLESLGHESPFEHVSFTFGVEGVSRSLTHQLVRHRIASYSQQSQRYVKFENFEFIVPPHINNIPQAKEIYLKTMENDLKSYNELTKILTKYHMDYLLSEKNGSLSDRELKKIEQDANKRAIEDARYVMPNAAETKIIFTMNVRSMFNFFKNRTCNRAQWEILNLATECLRLVKPIAPNIFRHSGPSCVGGRCPEGAMTCGEINEVRNKFLKL